MSKLHPIHRYCGEAKISFSEFARKVGFSKGYISQLVNGGKPCSAAAAIRISQYTHGKLGIEELITWRPRKKKAA